MTFSPVSTIGSSTANTFTLTPHAVGDFILAGVLAGFTVGSTADYATSLTSSNVTWSVLVAHTAFTASTGEQTIFIGKVTSTSSATVTIGFNAGTPVCRTGWQEFSNTSGYAAVTLDGSAGTVDVASSGHFPGMTPGRAGDLYWSYLWDNGTGSAGSTSGFTYQFDANGNPMAYNASCGTGTITPNIGDTTDGVSGIAVLLYEAVTSIPGAASLNGSGTLTAGAVVSVPRAASLLGTGVLTTAPVVAIPAAVTLLGTGTLTAGAAVTAPGQAAANLTGTGTLTAGGAVGFAEAVNLAGLGVLSAGYTGVMQQAANLTGSGVLSVAGVAVLKYTAGLFGAGFLSIPQVSGGLVPGVGGAATSQALPGSSQVAVAPQGSGNWQWLGTLGQVTALTYSYVCPGGCDKMTCTIMVPAAYRTQLFNPGWQVKIVRGGHQVWDGKLDEPQPSASGWTLTAVGTGNLGANFVSYFSVNDVWPVSEPDEVINRAISRGLPWVNPGLNSSPYFSQFWLGQATDPGSSTVTAFLNLICTRGGLTWYVNSQPGGVYNGDDLQVFPLPTVPNRLLVCTTPVARTLGGDFNSVFIRYTAVGDNATTGVAASYNVVLAQNAQSVAAHGVSEVYVDLSDAGVLSSAAAQGVGNSILALYQRASFAGPFQASYGQLLNTGGQAIDLGTDQAGTMVRMILTDFGLGGEVQPGPIEWIVGAYSYDDFAQVATITPIQVLDQSLTGLLSAWNVTNTPVAVAS